jgi:hypothetical protein
VRVAQTLVADIVVTDLTSGSEEVIAHGLQFSDGTGIEPDSVFPNAATTIRVASVTSTHVTVVNDGPSTASATFRAYALFSTQAPASLSPFLYQGSLAGSGGVIYHTNITADSSPITGTVETLTAFDEQLYLPASLQVGDTVRFRASGLYTDKSGAGTIEMYLVWKAPDGGTYRTIVGTSGVTPALNDVWYFDIAVTLRDITSGAWVWSVSGQYTLAGNAAAPAVVTTSTSASLGLQAGQRVVAAVLAAWSAGAADANSTTMKHFEATVYRP